MSQCAFCDHDLDEHEVIGTDDHNREIVVCAVKGCRCEQLEVVT